MANPTPVHTRQSSDRSAEDVARVLANAMDSLVAERRALALATYRLLAEGAPVSVEALGRAVGVESAGVERWLDDISAVFRDADGRIIGFWGLAIPETPHRFQMGDHTLHAWCAWDTLFMPALIGRTARVQSRCQATGEEITLTVHPERAEGVSPTRAVISMLAPAEGFGADVIRSFCHHVHFFASREAGERWLGERGGEGAFLLSIEEGFRLGELWNAHRFGTGRVGS